ncbi:MAG: hybrid sensor histidine kinase/response regulator [Bacteroidales bacterium]|nr:hybrid sensor histidine kinase/response regulator [Bacteroidales bacterium]
MEDRISILIVEDEREVLQSLSNIIGRRYSKVFTAKNAQNALAIFRDKKIDLVITDIRMPGMDGLTMLHKMKLIKPNIHRIVMSAYSDAEYFLRAIDLGVDGYIIKPFLKDKIIEAIEKSAQNIVNEQLALQSKMLLAKSEKEMRELNETKDKFFSIIGHDVKTPVSTIASYSSLLLDEYEDMDKEEIAQILQIIQKSSLRAIELLKNLLEWAKVQTGSIAFNPEKVNICDTISEEIDFASNLWEKKKIIIKYKPKKDNYIYADRNMVRTIFRNLFSNAIKFTPENGTIRLISERMNADKEYIKISIEDSGIGISPQIVPNLFSVKENYSSVGTDGETGSGMGLLFCKEFVDIQGGNIQAESNLGKGSTFSFSLPAAK